jgi:hypothetical protein
MWMKASGPARWVGKKALYGLAASCRRDPIQATWLTSSYSRPTMANLAKKYGGGGEIVIRRKLLSQLAWVPFFAFGRAQAQ